jgi:eukaryotic-like serine/threonine-protein kinase
VDSQQWLRLKELFCQAIRLPAERREAFIRSHCEVESIRDEIRKLAATFEDSSEFLLSPLQLGSSGNSVELDPMIGKCLNGFHVLHRIGAGGMGIVYEAQQENPSRLAAVKILQNSSVAQQNLWRLEHESEILAQLDHPGIARVYASGTFDAGRGHQPWFAMELVDGAPLHHYCATHQFSIQEKLELLLLICEAVQHAHERGVLHRDLKPANILVQERPGTNTGSRIGCPKIVDFGLACFETQDQLATVRTATGDILGTLSYMSPERFSSAPLLIDARCDVYSLGAVGYELLAGKLPLDSRNFTVAEAIRRIEQEEPPLLGQVDRSLRGDVEVIFAKALDKDLSRRYASVEQLASDIRRYLQHEQVLARPASLSYRLRKFARRNRVLVGGVVSTILALVVGIVLVAREAQRARLEAVRSKYEADKATAVSSFITNDFLIKLLATAHSSAEANRLPISELVATASTNIATTFQGQPLLEAAVRSEIGTIHYNLSEFEQAAAQYQIAMEFLNEALGPNHPDTLKAVNNHGLCDLHLHNYERAEQFFRQALQGRLEVLGETDAATLASMNNLAELLRATERPDEAEPLLRRAFALQLKALGPDDKNTLTSMANLGSLLASRGRFPEALELHSTVFEACERVFGPDNLTTLQAGSRFGQSLLQAGRASEARAVIEPNLEAFERSLGRSHNSTIISRRLLARIYKSLGDMELAKRQLELALAAVQGHPDRLEAVAKKIQAELKALEDIQKKTKSDAASNTAN